MTKYYRLGGLNRQKRNLYQLRRLQVQNDGAGGAPFGDREGDSVACSPLAPGGLLANVGVPGLVERDLDLCCHVASPYVSASEFRFLLFIRKPVSLDSGPP